MSDDLNDDAVEALLTGRAEHEPLGQLLASIAHRYASIPPPEPGPDLAAFMGDPPIDRAVVDRSIARRRHRRVVAAALTGTVLGKVVIGVSVAAASVAGMQAGGIVQFPGLPGPHHGAIGPGAPTTAASTTSPTTTSTTPSIDPEFTQRLRARDAGTVVLAVVDDEFLWVRPVAAAGWTHTLEQQPTAALVTFRHESGAVTVDATIEGEFMHVVIFDQRDGSSDEYWFDGNGRPMDDPTPPAAPAAGPDAVTPPAPAPVDDSDEDRIVDDDIDIDDHDIDDHDIDDREGDEIDDGDDDGDDDRRDEHDADDEGDREQSSSDDVKSEALRVDDDARGDDHDADD